MTLPYSRVVNVNLTRLDQFPTRRGFGVPIILTGTAVTDKLSATLRTRVYGSMDEVKADWTSADEFYKAALSAFSQNPRPLQIKAGYIAGAADVGFNAAAFQTQMDAIDNYDKDFYFITIESTMRDQAALDGLISWTQAHQKQAFIDSNDVGHETQANTTSVSARNKNKFDRTSVFYSKVVTEYLGVAMAAKLGGYVFDDFDSAYTAKFKKLDGISALNVGSAAIQSITGFTPNIGESTAAGHMANAQIDIGGRLFVVEGSTLTPNTFIDEVHAGDWIVARTEEAMLAMLLNNKRIPFTDAGMEQLASGPRTIMNLAARAGLIANDLDPLTGEYAPNVEYIIPSVFDIPDSQRKARIAPAIGVKFRYAGAVHYTTINYTMTF